MKRSIKKIIPIMGLLVLCVSMIGCAKTSSSSGERKLQPLYTKVDMNKLPDGIYHVNFNSTNVSEAKGDFYLGIEVYSEDLYDAVEVTTVKEGDVISYGKVEEKIEKIAWDEHKSKVAFNVDNFDDNIWCLCPSDSGGTYYFDGPDGHHSYTKRGDAKLKISKNCVVDDTSQVVIGGNEIKLNYDNVINYINNTEDCNFLNTSVRVENGEIVEINKWFIP